MLQKYDCILCYYVRKEEEAEAARAMSEAASVACGYPVKVEAKTVQYEVGSTFCCLIVHDGPGYVVCYKILPATT